jgi:hypothetical protein
MRDNAYLAQSILYRLHQPPTFGCHGRFKTSQNRAMSIEKKLRRVPLNPPVGLRILALVSEVFVNLNTGLASMNTLDIIGNVTSYLRLQNCLMARSEAGSPCPK